MSSSAPAFCDACVGDQAENARPLGVTGISSSMEYDSADAILWGVGMRLALPMLVLGPGFSTLAVCPAGLHDPLCQSPDC